MMWAGRVFRAALSGAPRGHRAQSALAQLRGILEEELEGIRGAGTWKSERVITSRQGPRIHVDGTSGGNSPSWESSDLAGCSRAVPRLSLKCEVLEAVGGRERTRSRWTVSRLSDRLAASHS